MPYAAQSDIEALYGADALVAVADRDGSGAADPDAVAAALVRASDEIDLHIAAAHQLPLPATPPQLVQLAVDIALYRLAQTADVRTDEHRLRYEDAVGALKLIAAGRARLTLPADPQAPDPDPDDPFAGQGPQPVVISGPERLFSRDKMQGLP